MVVNAALLARWLHTREPTHAKVLAVASFLALCFVAASWAIVTPRERIAETCRDLARFVDEGNVPEIGKRLASDFTASDLDREEFLDRVSAALTRTRFDHVRLRNIIVEMETDARAAATFNATCNIRTAEGFSAALPSRWRLQFTNHDQQWLVNEIESIPIPPLNLKNLSSRLDH